MYSSQPAQLATQRGVRGLPMILAAIVVLIIAALAVAVYSVNVGAAKGLVGDHSRDVSEGTRAAAFAIEDHSLDQIENQRVGFSKAHRPGAAATIQAAPAVNPNDSWESLRKEHVAGAMATAPAATSFGDLGLAPRTTLAAPAVLETMDSLRKEHLRGAQAPASDSIYDGHLRRVPLTKPAPDTWGGGR